jgi:hypothetical protein
MLPLPALVLFVEPPMPERVSEAYAFVANFKSKISFVVNMGQEELLAQQLRMAEYDDIIAEWRTTTDINNVS